jgi:hypothetical protein
MTADSSSLIKASSGNWILEMCMCPDHDGSSVVAHPTTIPLIFMIREAITMTKDH